MYIDEQWWVNIGALSPLSNVEPDLCCHKTSQDHDESIKYSSNLDNM